MPKYQFTRPNGPWSYPTLGFSATQGDVIESALPIDAWWEEADPGATVTIPATPAGAPEEPADGSVLVYRRENNQQQFEELTADIINAVPNTPAGRAALADSDEVRSTIAGLTAVPNVEVAGVYPARPDAPLVSWVGYGDPDAYMIGEDFWVNPGAAPPLTLEEVEAELLTAGSDLAIAAATAAGAADAIWLPAMAMRAANATTPTLTSNSSSFPGGVPVWRFPDGASNYVSGVLRVPRGWNTCRIVIQWTHNEAAASGSVRWRADANMLVPGQLIDAGKYAFAVNNVVAPAQDIVAEHVPFTTNSMPVTPGRLMVVSVGRLDDAGGTLGDTFNGQPDLIGVRMERLT
ncbi:hypothetical protein JNB63_02195 [Microbacterium trichothecenolyticum]|uniref:hypothetical protein n=1 Tax=Microbacterium trichothecenolyticum TaxID=69370 RepID=UPI001C6EC717|nr:hypothetical protein [Microbacterium trichothecenolyticum]MBW9118897.1 hypothetical protein [Microbacterium trichothecenolyticum]